MYSQGLNTECTFEMLLIGKTYKIYFLPEPDTSDHFPHCSTEIEFNVSGWLLFFVKDMSVYYLDEDESL